MTTRKTPSSIWIEPWIRKVKLPSGNWRFRLQAGRRGKGNRASELFETIEEARARKAQWALGGLPVPGAPPLSPKHNAIATLDDALRHRILDLEQRRKDAGVTERIRAALKRHWPEGSALPLHTVEVRDIEEYRDRRIDAGAKPNTVARELRELRATLKKARPEFKLPESIIPHEDLTRIRVLTPKQYDRVFPRLRELHGDRLGDLAELACLGVMRQADVRLLKRSYVRLAERVILLPRTKGGPRAVSLSPRALAIVKRALAREPQHELVFGRPSDGAAYSRVHVSRCWRQAARACGLEDFTFHDLRHHRPTLAANQGANDQTLQLLGGWRSAAMAKRYSHVLDSTLRRVLKATDPK